MHYRIVEQDLIEKLSEDVNFWLNEGYELIGGLIVNQNQLVREGKFMQAMVLNDLA